MQGAHRKSDPTVVDSKKWLILTVSVQWKQTYSSSSCQCHKLYFSLLSPSCFIFTFFLLTPTDREHLLHVQTRTFHNKQGRDKPDVLPCTCFYVVVKLIFNEGLCHLRLVPMEKKTADIAIAASSNSEPKISIGDMSL